MMDEEGAKSLLEIGLLGLKIRNPTLLGSHVIRGGDGAKSVSLILSKFELATSDL